MLRKNLLLICLIIVWASLAIVFSFYDLEISKTFVNENAGWAIYLEKYGMLPGLLVILFGIFTHYSYLNFNASKITKVKKIVLFASASGIFLYIINILVVNSFGGEEFFKNYLIVLIIVSILLSSLIIKIISSAKEEISPLLKNFSVVVIQTAFWGYVILVQVVKFFWGRMRFRDLYSNFSEFTPWFLPQGITGSDSFPSGHAAMGWMLLPLMILISDKSKLVKYRVLVLICFWAIAVSLSRVVAGAHYASDVLFGTFFIIITFYLFHRHYTK